MADYAELTICPTPDGGALVRPGGGPDVESVPPIATFTRRADADLFVAAVFAPPLERTRELVDTLAGALQSCEHQMSQMEGMFDDEDGTIAQAFEDAEHAQACVKAWRAGEPLPPPPSDDDDADDDEGGPWRVTCRWSDAPGSKTKSTVKDLSFREGREWLAQHARRLGVVIPEEGIPLTDTGEFVAWSWEAKGGQFFKISREGAK